MIIRQLNCELNDKGTYLHEAEYKDGIVIVFDSGEMHMTSCKTLERAYNFFIETSPEVTPLSKIVEQLREKGYQVGAQR